MTQEIKKDLMQKLSDVEIKSMQVENRKQFKELLSEINSVNTYLVLEAGLMVKNLPDPASVDEIFEGGLDDVVTKVKYAILDAQCALEQM